MKHLLEHENIGLVFSRQIFTDVEFAHIFVVKNILDLNIMGANPRVAPLYLYGDEELNFEESKTPNFTPEFNKYRTAHPVLSGREPEEILAYIYAVLHSPEYRKNYAEDLSYDYPRVPFTEDKEKFETLRDAGRNLIDLHLMKKNSSMQGSFPLEGDCLIDKPYFENGRIYINETQYFERVSEEAWNFSIGGYQVLDKWLKSRKDMRLSLEDINHFRHICGILAETIKIQNEINIDKIVYNSKVLL